MPHVSRETLRRFEQKMRNEGSDGFAEGPRPWEHWDESGHQENNRVWEGSARRVYPRRRRTRSLGYRLLSVLTLISLATLLVGIGGVYYSHTQSQQLAQNGIQPLPVTKKPQTIIASARDDDAVITATAAPAPDLNGLSAPAAGTGPAQHRVPAVVATAVAADEITPVTDEPAAATTIIATAAPETDPTVTDSSVDSVAIETVVTEKSVTTTVYTRHPRQDEAEIVAAIETTPPPFAHEVNAAQPQVAGALPPAVHITDDEALTAASTPVAASQTDTPANAVTDAIAKADTPADAVTDTIAMAETPADAVTDTVTEADTPRADAVLADTPTDKPATAASEALTTVAAAEADNEANLIAALAETAPATAAGPPGTVPDMAPAVQTDAATVVAAAEVSSATIDPEPLVAAVPETVAAQHDAALPDTPAVATAEAGSETAAPAVATEQPAVEHVAVVTPAVKTGGWVINLASYTWKSTASRKLALFQKQGVDAEIFAVTINDKPMYRVRVTGFANSREAKAGIPAIEETLDLEGAWISRR